MMIIGIPFFPRKNKTPFFPRKNKNVSLPLSSCFFFFFCNMTSEQAGSSVADHTWTANAVYDRLFGVKKSNDICCHNCVVFEQVVIKRNLLKPDNENEDERATYHFQRLKIVQERLIGEQHICNCDLSECHCPCSVCDTRRLNKTQEELNLNLPNRVIHKLTEHPAVLMTCTKTPDEDLIEGGANLCAFQFSSQLQPLCVCKCVRGISGRGNWFFSEKTYSPTLQNLLRASNAISGTMSGCCCPCEWCKLSPLLEIMPAHYPFSSTFPCSMINPSVQEPWDTIEPLEKEKEEEEKDLTTETAEHIKKWEEQEAAFLEFLKHAE